MKLHTLLYNMSKVLNDINALFTPKRTKKRIRNKIIGRAIGKLGGWRIWR